MRTCLQCGQPESLLPHSAVDLCKRCEVTIAEEARQRAQAIHRALRTLEEVASIPIKLAQCRLILQQAEALHRYEELGLLTISPPPSDLLREFRIRQEVLGRAAQTAANRRSDMGKKGSHREIGAV